MSEPRHISECISEWLDGYEAGQTNPDPTTPRSKHEDHDHHRTAVGR